MRNAILIISMLFFTSCIPLRIAPKIKDYRLTEGKRFKRGLPQNTTFVFEDPKDAGAFYDFVNTKFQLDDYYVDVEVPFVVDGDAYYFSFYEVEIADKALNIAPIFVDLVLNEALNNDNFDPITTNAFGPITRKGNWYVAIEVFSKEEEDCLSKDSRTKEKVLTYLRNLKEEYLSTTNYNEVLFKD